MKQCVRCGTKENLEKHNEIYFKISENSNPNIMKFEDCYVCIGCKKLSLKRLNKRSKG